MSKPKMNSQEVIDAIAQLEQARIHHQMYGTVYLKKPDGSIVLRSPEGVEYPIPIMEEYEDD